MVEKSESSYPKELYHNDYDKLSSFISYYHQIDLFRQLGRRQLLEIGIGNKTVTTYLRHHGFDVATCDFNENLEPDFVADIRQLPFEDNSFEVVMACEILEHLKWEDVGKAVAELHRVSSEYVIVSLPQITLFLELACKFPLVRKLFKRDFFDFYISLPLAVWKMLSPSHQWEIGVRNYPIRKIRKALRQGFSIEKEVRPVLNSRHHFFVLKKSKLE